MQPPFCWAEGPKQEGRNPSSNLDVTGVPAYAVRRLRTWGVTLQRFCIFSNLILAVIVFAAMIAGSLTNDSSLEEKLILSMLVLLFIVIAAGLITYHRWITVVAAMPVLFLSFSSAFLAIARKWMWAPQNTSLMHAVVAASLVVAALELSSVVMTFRTRQTR
jgi:NADH:ubiquinone oxidoreductase subunit K